MVYVLSFISYTCCMPYIELFSPLWDIVLISLVFNVGAYAVYAHVYGREFNKISSVNLRLSLVELLVVVANYANSEIVVMVGTVEFSWLWWYVIVSVPTEIVCFFIYKWYFKLSWKDISGA